MAAALTLTVPVVIQLELVHASPTESALTRCCGHTPFELKRTDRLTNDPSLVTCPGAWLNRSRTDGDS